MTLTEQQVREILAGCEGVTQGPWRGGHRCDGAIRAGHGPFRATIAEVFAAIDASHVARLDPQTVSALCEEFLSRRAADAAVRDAALRWAEARATFLRLPSGSADARRLLNDLSVAEDNLSQLALKSKASP